VAGRRRESAAAARARRAAVDDPAAVLEAAARLLEARPRSVYEVRRRLVDAGYRTSLVEEAVERLLLLGYLDDDAFARAWVESRDRARPRGARALRAELRRKGVPDDAVEAALAAREAAAAGRRPLPGEGPGGFGAGSGRPATTSSDAGAAALLLARRGAALHREADPRRRRAKAYALLARNGFDPDVCREAVGAWLAEVEREDEGGGDP